ncbi:MAG: hypothetical protein RJB09_917 [Pseudomonadota bacterium]
MTDKEAFLSRWSQRKRQIAEEARKAAEAAPATTPEPEAEEEPFDLSLLPDLEVLTAQTDMSLFLQKGVPDELRNAALRKIWALDPAIRDYVGDALDYAWDWNAPGGVPGGGELGAGFDTAKMVARIFGDQPADEKVIGDDALQQNATEVVDLAEDLADENALSARAVSENDAAPCTSVQAQPELATPGPIDAPHKKRRHGGASPVA